MHEWETTIDARNNPFVNAAIEFHDSTVAGAKSDGATVTVLISPAYVHRSTDVVGVDGGTVWLQDALMVLRDCDFPIEFPKLPLALYDGLIVAGENIYNGTVPFPLSYIGPLRIELTFEDGISVCLAAMEIQIYPLGEAIYLEEFPA